MEEEIASHPLFNNSFREDVSISSVELKKKKKKRKLQSESEVGLPMPKHKCRDRSDTSCRGSPTAEDKEIENSDRGIGKENTGKAVADEIDQQVVESDEDSNSYIEGYDTCVPPLPLPLPLPLPGDKIEQPCTSSNSYEIDAFKNALFSLDSRSTKDMNAPAPMHGKDMDLGGGGAATDMFEVEGKDTEHHQSEFGTYGDYIAGFENIHISVPSEELADDTMLYSNEDLASNEFVLSSGRWSVGQDALLGATKPTIDKEFEQYFSMLML